VRFGLIDTGTGDLTGIPVFSKMLTEGRLIESRDFTGQPDDNHRHGRSVLSIAAGFDEGQLIGPAYGAEVLHARTEYDSTETNQEEDNLVAALEWMESEGVDVVNISLGYTTFDAGEESYTYDDMDGNTAVTTIAADLAVGLGVVVVTSAGNAAGCGSPNNCWFYVGAPADADSVITVGAVDGTGGKAGFSSFGPTADGRIKPDVSAMGQGTYHYGSGGTYGTGNGTSFSSPIVAGVVAQMLQANPALTPIEVRDILRQTAANAANPNNATGWGIIDADAATLMAFDTHTEGDVPDHLSLAPPYPNPFSTTTVLGVRAPAPVQARLSVFDLLGRRRAVAFEGRLQPGLNPLPIDGQALPAGVYYYLLEAGASSATGPLVKVR
jgi:subtilisin family serine protease